MLRATTSVEMSQYFAQFSIWDNFQIQNPNPDYRRSCVSKRKNIATVFQVFLEMNLLVAAAAKSLQSCPTLCDPRDGSPPGSPVPGILQARTLEWVAISFSNAGKWKVKGKSFSRVWLFETPWTAAHQASPFMGFSRQECWNGVPLPSPLSFLAWLITIRILKCH